MKEGTCSRGETTKHKTQKSKCQTITRKGRRERKQTLSAKKGGRGNKTRMKNEHKKIESLQHEKETNGRGKKNDSSPFLFKHLGFKKRRQLLESGSHSTSNPKP